jgi:predicted DNA-binding ribbon-helix-helix protein
VKLREKPTSVCLEDPFWNALRDLAVAQGKSVSEYIDAVDEINAVNLSSTLRQHVFLHSLADRDVWRARALQLGFSGNDEEQAKLGRS